ncbi:inner membrane protein YnbA [Roseibium sp. TrichSKD4]|uniref:CDP-alcohol phosphatidyltransferase family protein n=1 Tax=Roseibium sp. TrichSKD4 TaxID=744980 RepID=UPI0001E56A2C|nr:CDP-alcohol phosphatidyltransferase family protein [Roseibium sp. TrichSKD4]EFO30742.1 inner membrane protein YnbA [Roseibium sp. TrichSKD4]
MPTVYQLKSRFQNILRPLCNRLASAGITANQVTIGALALSVVEGLAIYTFPASIWPFVLLPVILFVRMGLNAIDGMLAREHDQKSSLGAILNELGDVVSDVALYLPFAALPFIRPDLAVGLVVLAIIVEMTGIIGVQIGASRRYDGPFGKSDRAVLYGTCGALTAIGVTSPLLFTIVFTLACGLSLWTIWNRARNALRELEQSRP